MYLFDTSAWLNIESRPDCEDVWAVIISLIKKGELYSCSEVLDELRSDRIYLLRIKPHEKALRDCDRNDVAFLQHVGKITHDYPGMCKATGPKTPADPYVVALAELEGFIVVADETNRRRPNRKIPGVCEQQKIKCITLSQFIIAKGKK
ncbi:MAG: DUF4411 family protein [Candidatus Acidiferrales bacterium]